MSLVYLRNGDFAKAAEYMRNALALVKKGDYAWHDLYLNAAEIKLAQGDREAARDLILAVRKDTRRTAAIDRRIRDLLKKVDNVPGTAP